MFYMLCISMKEILKLDYKVNEIDNRTNLPKLSNIQANKINYVIKGKFVFVKLRNFKLKVKGFMEHNLNNILKPKSKNMHFATLFAHFPYFIAFGNSNDNFVQEF